jgi:GAF domain-containing protein
LALYEETNQSLHDFHRLLQLAMERVATFLAAESAAIILLDEDRQELYFHATDERRPGVAQRLRELRFPATLGIAGWVLRAGVSAVVPDVTQDSRFYPGVDVHIMGVLTAINKRRRRFSKEDWLVA